MKKAAMIRVLVVDDSPTVRELLTYILGSDPEIEIVGCAADGAEAIRMVREKSPDVITMDLHMPNVDGFEATRLIMQTFPTPIVVVSGSENPAEMDASFRAIEAGALVIVRRPSGPGSGVHNETSNALIRTVKAMAEVRVVRRWSRDGHRKARAESGKLRIPQQHMHRLVLIGASTGGPTVLRDILAELPPAYPLPILAVQHMSAGFIGGFVDWLSSASGVEVRIAADGEFLAGRCVYLAPDGFQIAVTGNLQVSLLPGRPEHGMCPSVSHLFRSIPESLCGSTVAVLLTGMGKDGAQELRRLKDNGAITIVQDRASAAVYGMPGEAIRLDAARLVLTPGEIGKTLSALGRPQPAGFPFFSS